ncbi:MAG: PD-(D/E)XK nuclease family protein [Thiobacillus sp.]|nr:PD-(D/E)XK nuclease family protein [Thiobacillus sp.]
MDTPPDPSLLPAATRFLELEASHRPDFSGCIVLIPHHHMGVDFRLALRRSMPDPVFLPPRLLTLPDLARTATVDTTAEPDSKRLAELHDFLAHIGHLPREGLWQAARELLDLLEEMDRAQVTLDGAAADRALDQGRGNPYLGLEATIARGVWQALGQDAPGRARAYGLRLAWLANRAQQPLYTLGLMDLAAQEDDFLRSWAERQPVLALPAPVPYPERHALLVDAWRTQTPPLERRAGDHARQQATSPLAGALAIHPAHNLETAARTAERVLLDWLAEGRRRIALVALDRLLARRLRALLERRRILVQDETGWTLSTSAVSHVVERWLAMSGERVWHGDLLDLLKSPFLFADDPAGRTAAAHGLEAALRRHGAPANLAGYQALARQEGLAEAQSILSRLAAAQSLFTRRRQPLAAWTRQLLEAMDLLGARPALAADPIGRQLLELLQRLEQEVAGMSQGFDQGDWRRWLFLHLEQTTFSEASVESPLRLTHLAAAHHRELEGVIILGAGAAHLPGGAKATVFNDATLRQLGLPGREEKEAATQDMLMDLLARTPRAAFIWQAEADGDPAPLSPWLVHLEAFHQAAWGQRLIRTLELPLPLAEGPGAMPADPPSAPRPPRRLSVSAWQSLVACPYQFFARHVLGLNEPDDMPEEMDKAEYGSLVHRILARFHSTHPSLENETAPYWEAELKTLSAAVFDVAEHRHFQAVAWRLRWERHIPDYVAWALGREVEGWRFHAAETPLEKAVAWGDGDQTLLYGRADRLDHKDGDVAVLDYKTQSRQTLRAKLEPGGEDVQLAAYAWLADATQAGFVSVDEKQVVLLQAEAGDDLALRAGAEEGRIAKTMAEMAAGAGLPAHGALSTCAWCEMQGLCRRAHRDLAMP